MTSEDASRPLVDILLRIGVELEEAAVSVEDLHALVEAAVKAGGMNETFLREAQTIDMLQQHLYALASFVSELSESMPESWRVESGSAMNKVKLSGLRERLSHIRPEETVNDDNAGDLQLF
ncbi:hypothetical protein AMST5_00618 [freshwater sediment metagenome]|jgi:hypothetical protein|uniref:Uncharacterized protein n=1 Tax=freshwater sediment metagenome TaxID=556182 RepID=A0AA48LXE8_9ZZZZ